MSKQKKFDSSFDEAKKKLKTVCFTSKAEKECRPSCILKMNVFGAVCSHSQSTLNAAGSYKKNSTKNGFVALYR